MLKTNTVLAIVGPTASGKSSLSHQIALEVQGEIISADSRLIYQGMNIGTAKPSPQELSELPYHMINVIEPNQYYSLGDYIEQAKPIIERILAERKLPIITGGTGFYLRGLLEEMILTEVNANHQFREDIQSLSTEELYKRLKDSSHIEPKDRYRIIRRLEIEAAKKSSERMLSNEFNVAWIGLNYPDRKILRTRIRERVHIMLQSGLVNEVKDLLKQYGHLELFDKTIGYKESIQYINEQINKDEMLEQICTATNQYARRQMTWFRANPKIHWLNGETSQAELIEQIVQMLK